MPSWPGSTSLSFSESGAGVAGYAAENRLSLEAAGRRLRYDFLRRIAEAQGFNTVATAHTQDDQAETVLLKFMRGSGTRGLAGIHPVMVLRAHPSVRFVRPLLEVARTDVEAYLASIDQPWREDESNLDHRFRRNRVRHELLPLLEREYNPNIRQVLVETAEIARGEEAYWDAALDPVLEVRHDPPGRLRLPGFQSVHIALQRRLLKRFLEIEGIATDFQHIEKVRRCATGGGAELRVARRLDGCGRGRVPVVATARRTSTGWRWLRV